MERKYQNTVNMVTVDCHSRLFFHAGDYEKKVSARSTAKPVQVLPLYLLGLDKKYGLGSAELAVMSSSHLAQEQHIRVLEQILKKTDIKESEIEIEPSAPTGRIAHARWEKAHMPKRKLYHPCVGNHMGLMLVQRELTGRTDNYRDWDSRVQKWIWKLVSEFSEYPKKMIKLVSDGCGVPSYVLPMKNLAIVYKNIMYEDAVRQFSIQEALYKNKKAIWENPLMLEGDGCLSTIVSSHKRLLAKTGAGGLLAVGIEKEGYGVLIQSDEGDWPAVAFMLKNVLDHVAYHDEKLSRELQSL